MTPELFTSAWFSALGAIILIDLVLAGDNALVIGLAARNVPPEMQRKVVLWGTFGAIAIRALLTAVVVYLLKIPGFLVIGGIALIYIGWRLTQDNSGSHEIAPATSVRGAVQTIIIADAVMGVDNVLAVGGAAQGSMLLVLVGLAVSVPIVVWGSTLVLRWVERFPAIIWLGAGVLGWTAVKMIVTEPLLAPWLSANPSMRPMLQIVIVGGLVAVPLWRSLSPRAPRVHRPADRRGTLDRGLRLGRAALRHAFRPCRGMALGRRPHRPRALGGLDSAGPVAASSRARALCGRRSAGDRPD